MQHHHSKENGEHYPRHECPIYAALKDGEVHHVTHEVFWRKDGSCFPVHYTSTPIWENNAIIGAVVVFQGVSKLKQAEAKVTLLQRKNELILASAGEGICGFGREGRVTFINPAAAIMLVWPEDGVAGKTIHDIFGRDEPDADKYCPVQNIMRGKQRFKACDKVFWRSDGTFFSVDFVSTRIMDNNHLKGQARHATSRNSGTPVAIIRSPTQRMGDALNALRPQRLRTKAASSLLPHWLDGYSECNSCSSRVLLAHVESANCPVAYQGLKITTSLSSVSMIFSD
ncbi:hypothetical protein BJAS_P0159 [Bathymodiolus japonicus methanotrophic gill symbiont]|nr:hypothetical protein BJAS_P0159 [Bathymodiolus japonicus methanotrophic gill symbiont]